MILDIKPTGTCGFIFISPTSGITTSSTGGKKQPQVANPGISQVEINHPFPTSGLGREQL